MEIAYMYIIPVTRYVNVGPISGVEKTKITELRGCSL